MNEPDAGYAKTPLCRPSRVNTVTNGERRVGVELEFTGLGIEQIATLVQSTVGGDIRPHSAYEYSVKDSRFGDFAVELDYAYLKERGRTAAGDGFWNEVERLSDDLLGAVAKHVVPLEIVCPPIVISELHLLHELIAVLRNHGARGTGMSAIYAFGLHLNPEVPDTQPGTILGYMRAFSVAFDWLRRISEIDLSRRVFPYIQAYDRAYVRKICDPDYAPDQTQLIDDYLAANASRNRALDMLPLFAYLDQPRVEAVIRDTLVKGRPTLHYRLPNCEIERPDWDLHHAWNHWLVVEQLAADSERLTAVCQDYCQVLDTPLGDWFGHWADRFEQYL